VSSTKLVRVKFIKDIEVMDRYKIPFAIQWIWPIPIIIGVYFAPESPWWCVQQGSYDRARRSLRRLARREGFDDRDEDRTMARMFTLPIFLRFKKLLNHCQDKKAQGSS
jgi:hypothetical protein